MTKYYRVRTQEQWNWLMKRFEKQGLRWLSRSLPTQWEQTIIRSVLIQLDDSKIAMQLDCGEKAIEVSELMEDEKMKDYVTINSEALKQIRWGTNYGKFGFIDHDEDGENHVYEQYLPANLEIPKFLVYPKVPMTEAEKKEFDKLKDEMSLDRHDLDDLLTRIKDSEDFPFLYHRLYVADGDGVESQLEFARAWVEPELIEVLPEKKWNVKVPAASYQMYYYKMDDEISIYQPSDSDLKNDSDCQFTAAELKHYGLDDNLFEKVEVTDDGTK